MNIKLSFLIILYLLHRVLTEDNSSADQKTLFEGLKNDENNSELNDKNKNDKNLSKPTEIVERGLVGDIAKLIKVAEILQTVGQKVIPSILTTNPGSAAIETEFDIEPNGLGTKGIHDGLFHIRDLKKNVDKLKNKK